MTQSTDRIERQILLKASRVARLARAGERGRVRQVVRRGARGPSASWPGSATRGQVTYPGYEHLTFDVLVEQIEPEKSISFRWHPAALDVKVDYSKEPATLVVFEIKRPRRGPADRRRIRLRQDPAGAPARCVPAEQRRLETTQMTNIEKHVATP